MKKTPSIKEFVKIFAMNARSIAWFLHSAQCNTYEQLFKSVKLLRARQGVYAVKYAKASTNDVRENMKRSRGTTMTSKRSRPNNGMSGEI